MTPNRDWRRDRIGQLSLVDDESFSQPSLVSSIFDKNRLTQARHLAGLTKKDLAEAISVSPVAVGQWESGAANPRPDNVDSLARVLDVSPAFFGVGRPYLRLEVASAHFRSLRKTPVTQRNKAVAYVEQVWELTNALEKRVHLPAVGLPGFSEEEVESKSRPGDPVAAAQALRRQWGLGTDRIRQMVKLMEQHGIVVTLAPFAGDAAATIDAFSTSSMPRPVVVLTPDRADDVYRHRFTAAHELGHLVLHDACVPADPQQEREADAFAAEFLTPAESITPLIPKRLDFNVLDSLSRSWGISVDSLLRRCKEVGTVSDTTSRRAHQRLANLRTSGLFRADPVQGYPGEVPSLLRSAFSLAESHGLTLKELAAELHISMPRLRLLLGDGDDRPTLELV